MLDQVPTHRSELQIQQNNARLCQWLIKTYKAIQGFCSIKKSEGGHQRLLVEY